jgi:hypothetical protein
VIFRDFNKRARESHGDSVVSDIEVIEADDSGFICNYIKAQFPSNPIDHSEKLRIAAFPTQTVFVVLEREV